MDCIVHGVAKSQTQLSDLHFREYKNPGSIWASQGGSVVKSLPPSARGTEMWVQSRDWEDSLEKEMATHSSVLAWRIPGTGEPGGLPSMGQGRFQLLSD